MSETLTNRITWEEAPPKLGEPVVSHWEKAVDHGLINPWRSWLRFTGGRSADMLEADPVSLGFISTPDGIIARDNNFEAYRQAFGWTDERDLVYRGMDRLPELEWDDFTDEEKDYLLYLQADYARQCSDPELVIRMVEIAKGIIIQNKIDAGLIEPLVSKPRSDSVHLATTAEQLVGYCRSRTFSSFQSATLGVTLEFGASLWLPEDHQDLVEHDVVAHQDWVRQDVPVVIALASTTFDPRDCDKPVPQLATDLYNTKYIYKGDLQTSDGRQIDYRDEALGTELVDNRSGYSQIWVADARRGLHGRPTMRPDDKPVVRLFMRGFVAPI